MSAFDPLQTWLACHSPAEKHLGRKARADGGLHRARTGVDSAERLVITRNQTSRLEFS